MAAPKPGSVEFMLSPNIGVVSDINTTPATDNPLSILSAASQMHSTDSGYQSSNNNRFKMSASPRPRQSTYPTPDTPSLESQVSKESERGDAGRMDVDPLMFSPVEEAISDVRPMPSLFVGPPIAQISRYVPDERPSASRQTPATSPRTSTREERYTSIRSAQPISSQEKLFAALLEVANAPLHWNIGEAYRMDRNAFLRQNVQETRACIGLGQKRPTQEVEPKRKSSRTTAPSFAGISKPKSRARPRQLPPFPSAEKPRPIPRAFRPHRQPLQQIEAANMPARPPARRMSTPKASRDGHTRDGKPKDNKPKDMDWRSIEDVCPPTDNLDKPPYDAAKYKQVNWAGKNAKDLSADPDRAFMHPTELAWATTLQINCATYLTCKRRIFAAKRDFVREEKQTGRAKPFSKTHAQTATRVDVNKASKLWEQFNNVGWFDSAYFHAILKKEEEGKS